MLLFFKNMFAEQMFVHRKMGNQSFRKGAPLFAGSAGVGLIKSMRKEQVLGNTRKGFLS